MTLPDIDALDTAGGALEDLAPVIDVDTDRPAAAVNVGFADATAATHTNTRAWVRMTLNGTAAPVLVAHDSVWGNTLAVEPTCTRSSPGVYVVTWPATVVDEIPNGQPGYNPAGHTLNLRGGWANVRGATIFHRQLDVTSANVATLRLSPATSGSVGDPGSATDVDVYVI